MAQHAVCFVYTQTTGCSWCIYMMSFMVVGQHQHDHFDVCRPDSDGFVAIGTFLHCPPPSRPLRGVLKTGNLEEWE